MGKITAITAGKHSGRQRSNVFLDGKFAFSLDNEIILKKYLKVGRELSTDEVTNLANSDHFQRCLNAAFRFLSYRPRSEAELRQRLKEKSFDSADTDRVIVHLKERGLLNDMAFADYWKENRSSFKPRSRRMVKIELLRKGVEPEAADEAVESMDDLENAQRAALTKARKLPVTDYQVFQKRLGSYLQRRGFSYGVINNTVKQAWQDRTGNSEQSPDIIQT